MVRPWELGLGGRPKRRRRWPPVNPPGGSRYPIGHPRAGEADRVAAHRSAFGASSSSEKPGHGLRPEAFVGQAEEPCQRDRTAERPIVRAVRIRRTEQRGRRPWSCRRAYRARGGRLLSACARTVRG